MGRYTCQQTDKAARFETWFKKQVEALKKGLKGAEILETSLLFRNPFKVAGEKFNNGFVSLYIRVDDRAPEFLTVKDELIYWHSLREFAKKNFGVEIDPTKMTSYASISFSEPSEDELYALTENKRAVITAGLQKIKLYVSWHRACAKRYKELVADEHQNAFARYLKLIGV